MNDEAPIVAEAGMLIRRPVAEVFNAVVDPSVTTHFWFTHGSAKLEAGKRVRWEWEMYGAAAEVDVEVVEEGRRIVMHWVANNGAGQTRVVWTFATLGSDQTFVLIRNDGFGPGLLTAAAQAIEATGGFTLALAGMKAWLERGIELNLVRDRHPEHWTGSAEVFQTCS